MSGADWPACVLGGGSAGTISEVCLAKNSPILPWSNSAELEAQLRVLGLGKIAEMIDDLFYRTATDFRWVMHDPVTDGATLYERYTFSYRSTLPEAKGARAMFEGVAIMQLRDGKITEYHEVANTAPAFVDLNFAPERIAKIVGKQGAALRARPEMQRHLAE